MLMVQHRPAVYLITASSVQHALRALQAYPWTGVQALTFIRRLGAVIVMSGDELVVIAETVSCSRFLWAWPNSWECGGGRRGQQHVLNT